MPEKIQILADLWQPFAGIVTFIALGVIRVELLGWRVKKLEEAKDKGDKELYAIRMEVQTINGEIVRELNEIREALAWIKGRFSMAEEAHKDKP